MIIICPVFDWQLLSNAGVAIDSRHNQVDIISIFDDNIAVKTWLQLHISCGDQRWAVI